MDSGATRPAGKRLIDQLRESLKRDCSSADEDHLTDETSPKLTARLGNYVAAQSPDTTKSTHLSSPPSIRSLKDLTLAESRLHEQQQEDSKSSLIRYVSLSVSVFVGEGVCEVARVIAQTSLLLMDSHSCLELS